MVTFVHIADARCAPAIERTGLTVPRGRRRRAETEIFKVGVFALPLIENFVVSHQWVRELKRRGFRQAVGVYFRLPDAEPVWAGAYNEVKRCVTAAQAAEWLRDTQRLGFEVIIPRSILASELRYVRAIPQHLGWRYRPGANGSPPFCGCAYCQRGNIKSRALQIRYERSQA